MAEHSREQENNANDEAAQHPEPGIPIASNSLHGRADGSGLGSILQGCSKQTQPQCQKRGDAKRTGAIEPGDGEAKGDRPAVLPGWRSSRADERHQDQNCKESCRDPGFYRSASEHDGRGNRQNAGHGNHLEL